MTTAYPYPLPAYALTEFCHPGEWHLFHHPRRHDREILAGNGYIALRCHRGAWLDSEYQPASAEFLSRWGKLPWSRWDELSKANTWGRLDDQRGRIFQTARIGVWLHERPNASPVWSVNEVLVRLSMLQAVATLPRVEIYTGRLFDSDPLWFRFSGGCGALARDKRLTFARTKIFEPRRSVLDGQRMDGPRGIVRFTQPGVNWPPADLSET